LAARKCSEINGIREVLFMFWDKNRKMIGAGAILSSFFSLIIIGMTIYHHLRIEELIMRVQNGQKVK
jgi:hypothetical protein